jgi:hypothetical protein
LTYLIIFFISGFIKQVWPSYLLFTFWLISIFIREGVIASI